MSHDRTRRRREDAVAFRPVLASQRLEARLLLTASAAAQLKEAQFLLTHPRVAAAKALNNPTQFSQFTPPIAPSKNFNQGIAAVDTARGGQSAIVAMPDGSRFRVSLSLADNQSGSGLSSETGGSGSTVVPSSVVQPIGTVRVYPMPGDQVGIIVDGSTQYQQLTIDPLPVTQRKYFAHSFAYGEAGRTEILNIGSIQINSGQIQAILGFHSANLDGPLTIGGTGVVDRIAFNSLLPGAAIGVAGTLNTLDIANTATLTAGVGINIGQDLNLLNIGGNLTLGNGASFFVGRDLGLTLQPPKGTGTGSNILSVNIPTVTTGLTSVTPNPSVSAYIQGNVIIGPGSGFTVGRKVDNAFFVLGNLEGASRVHATGTIISVPNPAGGTKQVSTLTGFVHGTVTP